MTSKKAPKAGEGKQSCDSKRPPFRPTTYSVEAAAEICAWLASGQSLKSFCKQPDAPGLSTVYQWLAAHKDFADLYTRAREDQADALADEMLDIADDASLDPNDKRVRIDTRKWIASKLKPRVYGDKVQTEIAGRLSLEDLVLGSFKMAEAAS